MKIYNISIFHSIIFTIQYFIEFDNSKNSDFVGKGIRSNILEEIKAINTLEIQSALKFILNNN